MNYPGSSYEAEGDFDIVIDDMLPTQGNRSWLACATELAEVATGSLGSEMVEPETVEIVRAHSEGRHGQLVALYGVHGAARLARELGLE